MPNSGASHTVPRTWRNRRRWTRHKPSTPAASDGVGVLGIGLEDLDAQVAKLESEIDSVRQREDRDRALIDGGTVGAKQVAEIQHELETLQRRQASLEDSPAGTHGTARGTIGPTGRGAAAHR